MQQRLVVVVKFIFVELIVLLVGKLCLGFFPDGSHGVEGLGNCLFFIFVFRALLELFVLHVHFYGVTDIVGVFSDQRLDFIWGQKFVVIFLLGVVLYLQNDLRSVAVLSRFLNGVALYTLACPHIGGVLAVCSGDHRNALCDHKRGIEAHAELTDNIDVLRAFVLVFKCKRAALGNSAEIVFQLIFCHAYAVIRNSQFARVLVRFNGYCHIRAGNARVLAH